MPTNKEALIRYRIINRCILDYKFVKLRKLKEVCDRYLDHEISERTIEQDIRDMRSNDALGYNAPIAFDRYRKAYYYEDSTYSIDNLPINKAEAEALTFAASMLSQFSNAAPFSTFAGAVEKIRNTMRIHRLVEFSPYPLIDFEVQPTVKGAEYLPQLIDSIVNKNVLKIIHQRFDREDPHHHILHPYYLKEYRNRWYVTGFQQHNNQIQSFGLERIINVEVLPEETFIRYPFNPNEYYRDVIGLMVPDELPVDIRLRFNLPTGKYILSQPVHHSQILEEETSEYVIIKFHLIPNWELISLILGWGPEVTVLEPETLINRVQELLDKSLTNYSQSIDQR